MPDVSRPRKRATRFEDSGKHRRKLAKIYYIVEDNINVYIDDIINHGIDNLIPIPTSYQSAINDPIHDTV